MKSKAGSFNTGTGAVDSTQEITIGFQAKVIFFWWNGRTENTDAVGGATHHRGYGVATSTSDRYVFATMSLDAQGNSAGACGTRNDGCVYMLSEAALGLGRLDISAIGETSFTLIVRTQMTADRRVHYLALGGDDVVNAKCGATQADATGRFVVSGLGWQPNFAMLIGNTQFTSIPATSSSNGVFSIGMASGTDTAQVTLVAGEDDGSATMDTAAYCTDNQMYACMAASVGTSITNRVDLSSFDAGGFTTAVDTAGFSQSTYALYVALNCTNVIVGNSLTRTDGNDITVSGLGWKPAAGMVLSHCRAETTTTTLTRTDKTSIGAFTSETERVAMGVRDEDNVADSNVATAVEHDEVYVHISDTTDDIVGLMDVKSVDAGGVTFVMDDADPAAAYFGYVLFGPAESGNPTINLAAATIAASGPQLDVQPGAVSKSLSVAAMAASGPQLLVQAITNILLDVGALSAGGQAIGITPGAVSKNLNAATMIASGPQADITPGAVSLAMVAASLLAQGQAAGITPGAASTALLAALLSAQGQSIGVDAGGIPPTSINLSAAALTANGQAASIQAIMDILLDAAVLSAQGQIITPQPGAISKALLVAVLTTTGQKITITAPSGLQVLLDAANLLVNGQTVGIQPGAVLKALSAGALSAQGQAVDIQPGAASIALANALLQAAGQSAIIKAPAGGTQIDLATATITIAGQPIVIDVYTALIILHGLARSFTLNGKERDFILNGLERLFSLTGKDRQ